MRQAELYRYYNNANEVIYIGVAYSAADRATQHRMSKSWWAEVIRTEIVAFDSRPAALAAEVAELRSRKPRYNILNAGGRQPHPVADWNPKSGLTRDQAADLQSATTELAAALDHRNRSICQAYKDGASLRGIAIIVGLSWSGVHKIINAKGAT